MNKKAIWGIIGLMSAAVLGVVCLQMDLISTSIRVNEEKFDKDVFNALNAVIDRLEIAEDREAFNYSVNGFVTNFYQRQGGLGNGFNLEFQAKAPTDEAGEGNRATRLLDELMSDMVNPCTCPRCVAERDETYRRLMVYYNQGAQTIPLVERIKLDYIKSVLRQELNNRGISTGYNYGVFSRRKNCFVILNDHYVVEEVQPTEFLPGYKNIYNSQYRVDLFRQDNPSPGLLMIHFPDRTSFVWRSLWLNLLGTILFTLIILFSFGYTIYVIFRQKKLSEMKTDFINNMTHEFKTPIATISLAADSISSPMIAGDSSKVGRFANIIKQENKRMNSQVEKVLQMALIDKREFSLRLTEVNLHDIIGHALENISLQVEKKNGTAEAVLEADKPLVQGDQTHLSNVINNLLDNANKYSPDNPEISIHTRNVPNGVEVIVKDKGIGMSKEARKHIFDKFYRVHTGNLHDVKGFGLGLSYVKAIVTAHKGTVDVKSELGKGSSFILFFPFRVES